MRQPILLSYLRNELRKVRSALWFRPAVMCALAALLAVLLVSVETPPSDILPGQMLSGDREAVQQLLRFMAGGMLTVTTVTQSVLMLVLSIAAGQASPRAVPELMADRVTQNALGTFLAGVVFSLSALTLLEFKAVEAAAIPWIFIAALLLLAAAIKYLVQWIHHVADAMKLNRIVAQLYCQARDAVAAYLDTARDTPAPDPASDPDRHHQTLCVISPDDAGYVQLIDLDRLEDLAESDGLRLELAVREGDFVHPAAALATVRSSAVAGSDLRQSVRGAIVIGPERSSEGDPLLGFELLTEVACRALSPSVNDPQTAVICVQYLAAVLSDAGRVPPGAYPDGVSPSGRLRQPAVGFVDMLERAFRPIVREGSASAEVVFQVVDALRDLSATVASDYLPAIVEEGRRVDEYCAGRLVLRSDLDALSAKLAALRGVADHRSGALDGRAEQVA